jgi:ribosomal-protein-alanine N-acetyltransferase
MKIIIRDFKESDLNQVLSIAQESFTLPWSETSFIEESKNRRSIFKVAEINNEVIGYIVVKVLLDEAEILSIATKPLFRKKGVATALLREVLFRLKDTLKVCYLEVRVSNRKALNFYKKFGFKKCGIRKNYYIFPQEDALLMKLDLRKF